MKKLAFALSSSVAYLSLATSAFAATEVNTCDEGAQFDFLCTLSAGNFGSIIGGLIQLIFAIAVIAALLYLIWGGFKWLTSGGDKAGVQGAREHIVAAIVGLVIIFLSYFIINLLLAFFNIEGGLQALQIPTITL